ncbi:zinc ABC transporter substrate-binding protein [Kocuria rosea]|uniref:metal ABC transporter substrate-binding protein n=1 Tax=Kocuria TaxID=57493 RepID=UPI00037C0C02|nr:MULTISPECIES: metal ABC transporter substrate-binding protein [Kocuria]EYT55670.1 ABC transporter substrate-binding protein [Kocuria sp. UCD-OTCP]MCM3486567.1 metal ABC transporter substrate-binding protein [Kocuria rosea]MEB2529279.1 metal ABC transporter substrate-binding protein [Kocuria rosea]MEB2618096.1 metal ABC transporter substrate-binding protein [Kocuria rosea]PWF84781.1 zinc ABC transporter substrate-binding protein [Kocuria rosea]
MTLSRALAVPLSLTAALALSSCASGSGDPSAAGGGSSGTLSVQASFYPLQYVTERVGGDLVQVDSLTPAGAEPHDLELSPAAVDGLRTADAVVYLSGFQPAVDDAVAQAAPEHALDAVHAGVEGEEAHSAEEHGAAEEAHSEEAHGDEASAEEPHAEDDHGHDHGGEDPHFWLDPDRLAAVATEVAHELAEVDPDNAETYESNAEELATELAALDEEFVAGLATCERDTIVVSHDAYGYLADKYDLEQVAIAGLDPDTEPSPARLAEIGKVVEAEGVTTVFSESLVNPKVAETLAAEHGIETAVLDPVENQSDENADYQQVMRNNLEALRTALDCA